MSDHDRSLLETASRKHEESTARLDELRARITAAAENPDAVDEDELAFLRASFDAEEKRNKMWADSVTRTQVTLDARQSVRPQEADDAPKPQPVTTKEPLTYRKAAEGGQHSFFKDQLAGQAGDYAAQQRLQRHMSEMRVEMRDLTTTDTAGGDFVPPLYLQSRWVELRRAGRVTADLVANEELPPGVDTINLPKLSTGAAVAIQASENSGVQETDPVTASVSAGVKTIAGQVDMSRQLFDRSNPGFDEIVMRDLVRDYDTKLDIQVISGSGLSGQAKGIRNVSSINTVTWTDASPTAGELYTKIADAVQRIASGMFGYPDAIVMHPRRWGMLLGAVDTAGRPLINAEAGQNALAGGVAGTAEGRVGSMQGLSVYVDANIPTNIGTNTREDVILVLASQELILFENGTPSTRVFESVGSGTLTVRISLWNYFAFVSERYPAAISVITGTGLEPPTF
jgi:HK97 family phage major capsid protein